MSMIVSTRPTKGLRDDALAAWGEELGKVAAAEEANIARQRQASRDALAGAILLTLGVAADTGEMVESDAGSVYWDHDGLRFTVAPESSPGVGVADIAARDYATIESLADLGWFLSTHPQKQ